MKDIIKGLKPQLLWEHFYEISQIPRGSKDETAIRKHIKKIAERNNFQYKSDSTGNIVVKKPAKPGKENKPSIAFQGHLDMVCEKNRDVNHDFRTDPIRLKRVDDWIKAEGTTLGADNGIGVAAALAVMESNELDHGPLEFLFTVDEESGLTGAIELSGEMLNSRILLNLDSEEDGVIYNGCAGGRDAELLLDVNSEKCPENFKSATIKLTGLSGGHSGLNIHEKRGNAIKLLNRFLLDSLPKISGKLSFINGGSKHNAIPREAEAFISFPDQNFTALSNLINNFQGVIKEEFKLIDPGVNISTEEDNHRKPASILTLQSQNQLINLISSLPHGVIDMSSVMPGVVETSTNLAVVNNKDDRITILTSQRSMDKMKLTKIHNMVTTCGKQAGATTRSTIGYPPWKPDSESLLLKIAQTVYRELFNNEPEIKAIHAGLECGIIGDKFPGMDMISFGPTILGAHSPNERVQISTLEKFWKFITALLKEYSE